MGNATFLSSLLTCWLHMSCVTCSAFMAKPSRFRRRAAEKRVDLQPRRGRRSRLLASGVGCFWWQCLKVKNTFLFCYPNEGFRPTRDDPDLTRLFCGLGRAAVSVPLSPSGPEAGSASAHTVQQPSLVKAPLWRRLAKHSSPQTTRITSKRPLNTLLLM